MWVAIVGDEIAPFMIVALQLHGLRVNLVDRHEQVLAVDLDSDFVLVLLSDSHLSLIFLAEVATFMRMLKVSLLLVIIMIMIMVIRIRYEVVVGVAVIRDQVALVFIAVQLELARVDVLLRHEVVLAFDLDPDILMVMLRGFQLD